MVIENATDAAARLDFWVLADQGTKGSHRDDDLRVAADMLRKQAGLRGLLAKYIDHVGQCTGRVFLMEIPRDKNARLPEDWSKVEFTEAETELLRTLAADWVEQS